MRADHVDAGPEQQMKRVAEDDLGAELLELLRSHRLHAAVSADRHERGRLDRAARKRNAPAPRGTIAAKEIKFHRGLRAYVPATRRPHRRGKWGQSPFSRREPLARGRSPWRHSRA